MDVQELLRRFTWVDWAVLLTLLAFAASGARRGFLLGLLDLAGVGLSLAIAAVGYPAAAGLLQQQLPLSGPLASLGGFLGLALVSQVALSAALRLLQQVVRSLLFLLGPLALVDQALGLALGLAKGLLVSTLLLLVFALLPLVPSVTVAIEGSVLASQLVTTALDLAPVAQALLGRELTSGLSPLPPIQDDQEIRIDFGPLQQLSPDPEAEAEMLTLVNQERARAGLAPLVLDEALRQLARAHSLEMFRLGYFSHDSPASGSLEERLHQAHIPYLIAGENLAYAPSVQVAHQGLMNSPGHRANILRPEFRRVGIGVIRSLFRGRMFTQEFTS